MKLLDKQIAPLGMGCWPIGGAMYAGKTSLGYSNTNDDESIKTIHAALAGGITLFDTAAAYGAGHSERLLARALKNRPDAMIATKIGIGIDESSKQLTFGDLPPAHVMGAIEQSLSRLGRDRIDLLLLHQNDLPIAQAEPLFFEMEQARIAGKLGAYGWSTDFSRSTAAMACHDGFIAIEHAMNVFEDAPRIQSTIAENGLAALIRSPLAMGLLTGKYDAHTTVPPNDIRATKTDWVDYFKDGQPNPQFLTKLNAVRDILTIDGRSLVQGALGWIWAKRAENIPIPGARTVAQIEGITGALSYGPLPDTAMREITQLIPSPPVDQPERAR